MRTFLVHESPSRKKKKKKKKKKKEEKRKKIAHTCLEI
jgi:hypothetical protein